ncbi:MAG: DUF1501 domain-containing protein [Thermoleophilia bacterium]|nr:DUF1501 domain-containing protein [Thermoleophilia bacterium]
MTDPRQVRGCQDHKFTRRALARASAKAVPIPAEALDGLDRFARDGGLTRRDAMKGGAGMVLMCAAAATLTPRSVMEAAAAQQAQAPDAPILVSLYLDGGNDGLNTLVPVADAQYRALRGPLALGDGTVALKDTNQFRWHPSLGKLAQLYDQGKVAVLPAVDYANPDQSHFNSVAYWRTGVVGPSQELTGWLGRTMDVLGAPDNPLQAVSISGDLDPVLRSRKAPVGSVYDPGAFDFWIPEVWGKGFDAAYREASRGRAKGGMKASRDAYANAFRMVDMLQPLKVDKEHPLPPTPVAYPDTDLGRDLRSAARIMGAGFGTRVVAVSTGGYDTHDDQLAEHADLLSDLSESLWAFQADIDARGLAQRVLVMIWSEFGRRPKANGTGTDHGAGGLLMLVGNRANGGIRSEFPGLSRLDDDDNLLVTTEFRTVYSSLLEQFMGVEAGRVLPAIDGARIPLVR